MEGRYFVTDLAGHLKMLGPDGKPKDITVRAQSDCFQQLAAAGEYWEGASGAYR